MITLTSSIEFVTIDFVVESPSMDSIPKFFHKLIPTLNVFDSPHNLSQTILQWNLLLGFQPKLLLIDFEPKFVLTLTGKKSDFVVLLSP
jgi:hypothetical protein